MKDYVAIADAFKSGMAQLGEGHPNAAGGFKSLMQATIPDGALSMKTKELIALAIAITVRCDGCVAHHARIVCDSGATREEVMETIGVAMLMGGGPSVVYGIEAMQAFDQFAMAKAA